jgi:hypothetical protein
METTIIFKPHQFSTFAYMVNLSEKYYSNLVAQQLASGEKIYEYQLNITHCEAARSLQGKCFIIFNRYRNKLFSKASIKFTYPEIALITSGILPADNNDYNFGVRQYVFEQCYLAVQEHSITYSANQTLLIEKIKTY